MASCGGSSGSSGSGGHYSANGVSYDYPSAWVSLSTTSVAASTGNKIWDHNVGPAEVGSAKNKTNLINVSAYQLSQSVTPAQVAQVKRQVGQTFSQTAQQGGGQLSSGPDSTTVGGLPGYELELTGVQAEGETTSSRIVLVFKADKEYLINCQYTSAEQQTITSGCDQVIQSFKVSTS
jgi:hypothetical protein